MKKNLKNIFLGLSIFTIILGSPILLNRIDYEKNNNTYEIGVSAQSILNLNSNQLEKFYREMKRADVSTLVFDNITMYEIEKYRHLEIDTVSQFIDKDKLSKYIPDDAKKENVVIKLVRKDFLEQEIKSIREYLDGHEVFSNEETILFYIDKPITVRSNGQDIANRILTKSFFIDEKGIKDATKNDLNVVISIINQNGEHVQEILVNQILDISDKYDVKQVQLRRDTVLGYPNNIGKYLVKMHDNGIFVSLTEFQSRVGLSTYSNLNQGDITRAHEISVDELKLSEDGLAERIARAIKERNMRFISLRNFIDYRDDSSVNNSINSLSKSIQKSKNLLGNKYNAGTVSPIPIMEKQLISEVFVAISFSALVGALLLSILKGNSKIALGIFAIVLVGTIGVVISKVGILIKGYAFVVSIIGACAAIIIPYKSQVTSYILKYITSAFIAVVTGVMISSIMYGTDYMLKLKSFSGVKFLYIAPPIIIAIWVILTSNNFDFKKLKSLEEMKIIALNNIKNMKLYHYISIILVIFVAYVYLVRSGNTGTAGAFELELRAWMEKILYVRPRTKEFMLGYPALFIAYYLYKQRYKYSQYVLILGAVATMSTVNTFTHLHTPFLYSLLRTTYGVVFGAIVGVIYISIFKIMRKYIKRFIREA